MQAAPTLSSSRQTGAPVQTMPADFDDPVDLKLEEEAKVKRETAFFLPLIWEGKTLNKWSLMRHALHHRMMQHLAPVPPSMWGNDQEAHAPDSLLFLWLAHQEEKTILVLAGQPVMLWMSVFAWAETAVPLALWPQALKLMLDTFEAIKLTEVKIREEAAGGGGKSEMPSL